MKDGSADFDGQHARTVETVRILTRSHVFVRPGASPSHDGRSRRGRIAKGIRSRRRDASEWSAAAVGITMGGWATRAVFDGGIVWRTRRHAVPLFPNAAIGTD